MCVFLPICNNGLVSTGPCFVKFCTEDFYYNLSRIFSEIPIKNYRFFSAQSLLYLTKVHRNSYLK
jgi:hypothetical protein